MSETTPKLLVVEDDDGLRRQLRWAFDNCEVVLAGDRESAVAAVAEHRPPVALVDLGLPPDPDGPTEGLATLQAILSIAPETKVVMMSGQTEREYAVQAVALGAYDFYQKPIEIDVVNLTIQRAYNLHALESENRRLARAKSGSALPGVTTTNAEMLRICGEVRRFAGANVAVVLIGESGTGKELLARATHELSDKAKGPYIAINCAAIPEHLLESELFGHEKGAFTGAVKTTVGKVELANGGTLFLDEIGDLPLSLQAKLLRFLQERVIERIGGHRQIPVDIRLVSATNKDLLKLTETNEFREDLYYRLSEAVIKIPPLRERPDDAVVIAHQLLNTFAEEQGRNITAFTADALASISSYEWPGNVRELQNRVKRSVAAATGAKITVADLDLPRYEQPAPSGTLREYREQAERTALTRAMVEAQGNISKVAKLLDVSRPTVYDLMRQHNMKL
jgi:two-component system NtrC family response regulator